MAAPFDTTTPVTNALANNKMGPIGSFIFRKFYKDKGMPGNQFLPTPIDIWYDKPFFGRVDQNGVTIYPSETNFKQLPSEGPETFWAFDFVTDAFSDFQAHIEQAVELGLICGEGKSNITKLVPGRAWADIHDNYNSYSKGIYNTLVTNWFQKQQRNSKIKNFSDFLHEFMEFVDDGAPSFPITKSGFILSRFFTPLSSALIVEISDDDHSEDITKQEAWIRDPNFTFYIKAARNFGFVIDKNAPWRLCADINNPIMKKYMKPYGLESSSDLFEKYYYKCHFYDIETLKIYLVEMYNAYVLAYPNAKIFRTKQKGSGGIKTVSKKISRKITDLISVNREFGPEFWLKTYYYIRLREMGVPRDPVDFNKKLKNILQHYKLFDFNFALSYTNDIIRKIKVR
jgi:hypothetical protein